MGKVTGYGHFTINDLNILCLNIYIQKLQYINIIWL